MPLYLRPRTYYAFKLRSITRIRVSLLYRNVIIECNGKFISDCNTCIFYTDAYHISLANLCFSSRICLEYRSGYACC